MNNCTKCDRLIHPPKEGWYYVGCYDGWHRWRNPEYVLAKVNNGMISRFTAWLFGEIIGEQTEG